jgi:hypothetical protein
MVDISFKDLTAEEADFMNNLLADAKMYNNLSIMKLMVKKENDMQSKIDWHNRKLEMYEKIIDKIQPR